MAWEGVTLGMSLKTRHELAYLRRTNSARADNKRREHEDWLVLLAFNHLFAGLEAYVGAHLTDFPGDLKIQARARRRGRVDLRPDPPPMNRSPIGIFDSGIGGLTVARAIFERLPGESTVYFGDTARVPYGPKSPETVRRYSLEILRWLLEQGVKAVVIACNTSTAHALETLQAESPVPVIGVIEPGARRGRGGGRGAADRCHRHRRHHREQRLRQGDPPGASRCEGGAAGLPALRAAGRGRLVRSPGGGLIAREYLAPLTAARGRRAGARAAPTIRC